MRNLKLACLYVLWHFGLQIFFFCFFGAFIYFMWQAVQHYLHEPQGYQRIVFIQPIVDRIAFTAWASYLLTRRVLRVVAWFKTSVIKGN